LQRCCMELCCLFGLVAAWNSDVYLICLLHGTMVYICASWYGSTPLKALAFLDNWYEVGRNAQ
jgi:hypothetical protein